VRWFCLVGVCRGAAADEAAPHRAEPVPAVAVCPCRVGVVGGSHRAAPFPPSVAAACAPCPIFSLRIGNPAAGGCGRPRRSDQPLNYSSKRAVPACRGWWPALMAFVAWSLARAASASDIRSGGLWWSIPGHWGQIKWAGLKHNKISLAQVRSGRKIVGCVSPRPAPSCVQASPPARRARHGTTRLAGSSTARQ
jgi:hypothetical protein